MNYKSEKSSLEKIIKRYLEGIISLEALSNYAWEKITSFSNDHNHSSSPGKSSESEYWYAIWQIQHLADSEHAEDGTLKKELLNILNIFDKKKSLPKELYGKHP